MTAGSDNWLGLGPELVSQALVLRAYLAAPPDTSVLVPGSVLGVALDLGRTDTLVNQVYRYSGLFTADTLELDPTDRNIAVNLSLPFLALGQGFEVRGDRDRAVEALRKGYHLSPDTNLRHVIEALAKPQPLTLPIFGDTVQADTSR